MAKPPKNTSDALQTPDPNEVLRRMLKTPPKPHKPKDGSKTKKAKKRKLRTAP